MGVVRAAAKLGAWGFVVGGLGSIVVRGLRFIFVRGLRFIFVRGLRFIFVRGLRFIVRDAAVAGCKGGERGVGLRTFALKLVSACAPALSEGIVGASDAFSRACGWGL